MPDLIQLAVPVFFALIALEAWVAARRDRQIADARYTASSLALGVGSVGAGLLWGGVALAACRALYAHRIFDLGTHRRTTACTMARTRATSTRVP